MRVAAMIACLNTFSAGLCTAAAQTNADEGDTAAVVFFLALVALNIAGAASILRTIR